MVLLMQPALAYCSCSESFFVEECGCAEVAEEVCACQKTEETPCDDCGTAITLDLDDHFWVSLTLPSASELGMIAPNHGGAPIIFVPTSPKVLPPTRPPPPPGGPPLYLFLGILRL